MVTFDQSTLTFTFFNDSDLSIASANPYGILLKGITGSETPVEASAMPLILTIKNPCLDTDFVSNIVIVPSQLEN